MRSYQQFEYNKTYTFPLNESDLRFGPLEYKTVVKLFQDGRSASFFIEQCLPLWFPSLKYATSNTKGYDLIDTTQPANSNRRHIDQKTFTKHGVDYSSSLLKGGNRVFNDKDFFEAAMKTSYCITDVRQFPTIHVVFWEGKDLIETFKSRKITASKAALLFLGIMTPMQTPSLPGFDKMDAKDFPKKGFFEEEKTNMKNFEDIRSQVNEAASRSLSRLHGHLESGKTVGIISASRGNLSAEENNKRTKALHASLKKHGYAPVPVKGEYVEDHEGKQKKVKEKSFMIHHSDHEKLVSDLKKHGETHEQDTVLTVSKKHGSVFHGTGKSEWVPKGQKERIGGHGLKSGPEIEKGDFKSRLKHRPFIVGGGE